MKEILNLSLKLGLICALAGAALVAVNVMTTKPRQEATDAVRNTNLKLVLPPETHTTAPEGEIAGVSFFAARDATGNLIAYAAEGTSKQGFGGKINVLAGLNLDGSLIAVLVNNHAETPGIGTQVTDRKITASLWAVLSGKHQAISFPPNRFLDAFHGRHPGALILNGSSAQKVAGISGATISSRAVLDAVNQIGLAWREKQNLTSRSVNNDVQP